MAEGLGHLDPEGRLKVVDVGAKPATRRRAVAVCRIRMSPETVRTITEGGTAKGDALAVAQVAGILAAKRTPELVPGCHPLRIDAVEISFATGAEDIEVRAEVRGTERTGFEMEALTACAVAALTVYDMAKGVDPDIEITGLRLVEKSGGTSMSPPPQARDLTGVRAVVLTVSDSAASGEREDRSGPAARAWLERAGAEVAEVAVVPDDREAISRALRGLAANADLVVTTGGTGVGPRDVTPEATADVADRIVPGLAEAIRLRSMQVTPNAMLSRGTAVLVGPALVVNLPGSTKAVGESLKVVAPVLQHAVELLRGGRPH